MTASRARRPWHVFVRDIGPTFTFATQARAAERAADLTGPDGERYAEVLVYSVATGAAFERWVYRFDTDEPRHEVNDGTGRWVEAEAMTGHTDECEMMVRLLSGERCTCGFDPRAVAEVGA